jgi:glyoxylase-like metal-dependent hydrolase (beta-lactamase superfamily II)
LKKAEDLRVTRESIAPGVARLVVPTATLPPATSTNAWLLGTDVLTVIDPGASDPAVQRTVAEMLSQENVERIILTHHHPDHTSGARHLALATGAPVVAHPDTGAFYPDLDGHLQEGDHLAIGSSDWVVLHTPGHAHGHICLMRASDGYAVVGDLLAGEGTILIGPPEGHLETYLHSLRRLKHLGVTQALPAHGQVLHAPVALDLYLAHRAARTEQVRDCLAAGLTTPLEMARRIYADLPEAFHPLAAHQIRSHLTWLVERQLAHSPSSDCYALV